MGKHTPTRGPGVGPGVGLGLGLAVGLMLGLAGCGASDPAAPGSPTVSPSATVSARPTTDPTTDPPTGPPPLPDAARQHTKAGAKAFVVYFWQVVDYATTELEPDSLTPLVRKDCTGCAAGLDFIKDAQKREATIRGGAEHVESVTARHVTLGTDRYFSVEVTISNTKQHVHYADGTSKTFPASKVRDHLMLQPTPAGWTVASLESA